MDEQELHEALRAGQLLAVSVRPGRVIQVERQRGNTRLSIKAKPQQELSVPDTLPPNHARLKDGAVVPINRKK